MYDAVSNSYCYPGTTVLKNRAGLRTQADLDFFEEEATAQRFTEPLPAGKFDARHLRAIHRHLFQDVYAWAGSPRTVESRRAEARSATPRTSTARLGAFSLTWRSRSIFRASTSDSFANKAAHFLAELNAIHPFREGNGRTQLSFMTVLAEQAGHPFALERIDPKAMLDATITSFGGSEKPLSTLIRGLID